ncbi:uncharacterized protein PGRI_095910 [Penicillium griseofulvum]|uniref:Ubiquitin supergroup n=1 Tax=Penicillium patulum TaxID=5078 RepID=A0A135L851_PENPA|nr:uncharacterized protein PGRI_095910 [Penicillium griseofulvum]KXG45133.1 hypothetical protein PGRI_095910 [Penicillium griseofulvum]
MAHSFFPTLSPSLHLSSTSLYATYPRQGVATNPHHKGGAAPSTTSRSKIQDEEGCPLGKQLEDGRTLSDYNIRNQDGRTLSDYITKG